MSLRRLEAEGMAKKELPYLSWSDEDVVEEMQKRLKEIKQILIEIRDSLKNLDYSLRGFIGRHLRKD